MAIHGKGSVLRRFFVGISAATIFGKQMASEKNSCKKTKSIQYNKKIVGYGFFNDGDA